MTQPIFFDPTGRRSRMSKRVLAALLVMIVLSSAIFALTLIRVPRGRDLALPLPQPRPAALRLEKSLGRGIAGWLPNRPAAADPHSPLSIGFYVPGDDASIASLRRDRKSVV